MSKLPSPRCSLEGSETKTKPEVEEELNIIRTGILMSVSPRTLSNTQMLVNDSAVVDWKREQMLTLVCPGAIDGS